MLVFEERQSVNESANVAVAYIRITVAAIIPGIKGIRIHTQAGASINAVCPGIGVGERQPKTISFLQANL